MTVNDSNRLKNISFHKTNMLTLEINHQIEITK